MSIEQRMRTLRTLWIALLASVGMYYGFTLFASRPENLQPNSTLSLTLLGIGVATTLISFLVKNRLISRAIEQRRVDQVHQGYVIAWAMSEVAALFGLVDFFVTNDRYYYVLMIIAACGQLLHYPRCEHFESASFNPHIIL